MQKAIIGVTVLLVSCASASAAPITIHFKGGVGASTIPGTHPGAKFTGQITLDDAVVDDQLPGDPVRGRYIFPDAWYKFRTKGFSTRGASPVIEDVFDGTAPPFCSLVTDGCDALTLRTLDGALTISGTALQSVVWFSDRPVTDRRQIGRTLPTWTFVAKDGSGLKAGVATVPEPSLLLLMAAGFGAAIRRRRH